MIKVLNPVAQNLFLSENSKAQLAAKGELAELMHPRFRATECFCDEEPWLTTQHDNLMYFLQHKNAEAKHFKQKENWFSHWRDFPELSGKQRITKIASGYESVTRISNFGNIPKYLAQQQACWYHHKKIQEQFQEGFLSHDLNPMPANVRFITRTLLHIHLLLLRHEHAHAVNQFIIEAAAGEQKCSLT